MGMVIAFGQLCLVTVFVWSGLLKARDLPAFSRHVGATIPWLSGGFAAVAAAAVPAVEVGAAGLLLMRQSAWIGCAVATFLLVAFTGYLVSLLLTRPDASCGCTGANDIPVSGAHIVRNVLLLGLSVLTWWATMRASGPDLTTYAVTAAPAVVVGVAVLHFGELASLFRPTRMT